MTAILKGFVRVGHGQVHYRYGGKGPIVVLLHESPRSSAVYVPTIEWLGEHFTVVALDLPGCGGSTPLPAGSRTVPGFATVLADALTTLGIERCALYGARNSAAVALRFAVEHPQRAALTILDDAPWPHESGPGLPVAQVPEATDPSADGAHLPRLWSRVLDLHRYSPWYERTAGSRLARALPDDSELHAFATDLCVAGPTWAGHDTSSSDDLRSLWPRISSPVTVVSRTGDEPETNLEVPAPLPENCSIERIAPQLSAWRTALFGRLKRASLARGSWCPPAAPVDDPVGERRGYVNLVHGQVCLHLRGRRGRHVPVLLLPDVPGGTVSARSLAALLAEDRLTLCPDLPGLGESHPLPYPTLGSFTAMLHDVLVALELPVVDLVAEGLGCCFAAALAAHQPKHVRRLVLDGVAMVRTRERQRVARRYCPPIEPDRYGAYLQRIWQQRRDVEACWPWFDRSARAARRRDAELDLEALEADFIDIMKQLPSYGDAARAALGSSMRDILAAVRQPVLLFDVPGDVRYAAVRRAARRLTAADVTPRAATPAERAGSVRRFLD
jgi:pimeloyl-ACP methyl ester carboxylesterase